MVANMASYPLSAPQTSLCNYSPRGYMSAPGAGPGSNMAQRPASFAIQELLGLGGLGAGQHQGFNAGPHQPFLQNDGQGMPTAAAAYGYPQNFACTTPSPVQPTSNLPLGAEHDLSCSVASVYNPTWRSTNQSAIVPTHFARDDQCHVLQTQRLAPPDDHMSVSHCQEKSHPYMNSSGKKNIQEK